jgi:Transposase IS4
MTLVDDYLYLGHCIVMNNYYSSPKLFLELVKRKIDAVGIVRSNRKSLPLDFRNSELKNNERIARYYKKVTALK